MKPDLVTGATGFIGRHLAQRLIREGRKVRLFCRHQSLGKLLPDFHAGIAPEKCENLRCPSLAEGAPECPPFQEGMTLSAPFLERSRGDLAGNETASVEIVYGDLLDRPSIERALEGVERVFHCAGCVSDWGPLESFHAVNMKGTEWLAQAALNSGVKRFIHVSSIAVFGVPTPPYFDDDSPYGPGKDPYSRTKIQGEAAVLRLHREQGLPATVLRPAVVYGPYSAWVEEPVHMIRRGKMFLIGGGKGTCHPCYINTLLDAMLLAADHPASVGQAYIVGDDHPILFKEYFNALADLVGAKPIKRSIPVWTARLMATLLEGAAKIRRSEKRPLLTHTSIDMVTTRSVMVMEKIRRELGFRSSIPLQSGVQTMKEWVNSGL